MITELTIVAGTMLYFGYKEHKKHDIKRKFNLCMSGLGIKNKDEFTYEIMKMNKEKYGYNCLVSIPYGLNFLKFEDIKDTIEDNLGCMCEINKDKISNYIKMKIINNPQNDTQYIPVKTKAYELMLGLDVDGKPILLNVNKFAHLLIAGVTGSGKSREVFVILTNLLYNHSKEEIELYLTQVRKRDLKIFKQCVQVKWYAERLDETKEMFDRIDKIIERRVDILDKAAIENIEEYNKVTKKKMKYIYLFAEEFSFYMPDTSDDDETKALKAAALKGLKNIILSGRAVGVTVVCSLQRSTVDNIPSTIKSQMTRLTFRQISKINSDNIIETTEAIKLEEKEAILFSNKYTYLKVPYINRSIIQECIGKKEIPIKVEKEKVSYSWKSATNEDLNKLEDITIQIKEEAVIPIGKINNNSAKGKKRRSGVISLKEVSVEDAKTKR